MKIDKIVMALAAMGLIIGGADAAQPGSRFAPGGSAGPMKLTRSNAMSPAEARRAEVIARVPDTIYEDALDDDDDDIIVPAFPGRMVRQSACPPAVPGYVAPRGQLVRQNAMDSSYGLDDDDAPPAEHPKLVRQNAMVRYDDEEDAYNDKTDGSTPDTVLPPARPGLKRQPATYKLPASDSAVRADDYVGLDE